MALRSALFGYKVSTPTRLIHLSASCGQARGILFQYMTFDFECWRQHTIFNTPWLFDHQYAFDLLMRGQFLIHARNNFSCRTSITLFVEMRKIMRHHKKNRARGLSQSGTSFLHGCTRRVFLNRYWRDKFTLGGFERVFLRP